MNSSNEYLVLLRNTDWDEELPVEDIAKVVNEYHLWVDRMLAEGKLTGGRPLTAGGRVVSKQGGRISDGPFVESKEAIGGYLIIQAESFDEAAAIASTFPPIRQGVQLEIRELTTLCLVSQRLEKRLATA
ncbi:YciI family protein [Phragmitibacter flavus]|nr:YciI family protein [Phragmitibacter flavus]